jgi:hypothetical protein
MTEFAAPTVTAPGSDELPFKHDAKAGRLSSYRLRTAGVALTCVGLVALGYLSWRAQNRPPAVFSDDAWQLFAWKAHRWTDFHRATYTAFGFGLLERLWLSAVSFSTSHARILPLVFGLAIPPTFLLVGMRMRLRFTSALLGAVVLLVSPELVGQVIHVKQYMFDVVWSILVIGCADATIRNPSCRAAWVRLGVLSAVGLVFSFATVGVVVPAILIGAIAFVRASGVREFVRSTAARIAAGVAVLAGIWFIAVIAPNESKPLHDFWSGFYLRLSQSHHDWALITQVFKLEFPVPWPLFFVAFILSCVVVAIARPLYCALFLLPVLLAIAAAFAEKAPLGAGRTETWLYPPMVFMIVTAVDLGADRLRAKIESGRGRGDARPRRYVADGLVAAVSCALVLAFTLGGYPAGGESYPSAIEPVQPNVVPLIARMESQRRADDLVVVGTSVTFLYALYAPQRITTVVTPTFSTNWAPKIEGIRTLMWRVPRVPPFKTLESQLESVHTVWIIDGVRYNIVSGVRPVLVRHGFHRVGNWQASNAQLDLWTR